MREIHTRPPWLEQPVDDKLGRYHSGDDLAISESHEILRIPTLMALVQGPPFNHRRFKILELSFGPEQEL
jgi:hypothetical protein